MANKFLAVINLPVSANAAPPDLRTKPGYRVGEMSSEIPGSVLVFFLLFSLTNVAGLNLAFVGALLLVGNT
jgi:GPH family glycoside/pentoside/hexuronide:cation symporter